MTESAMTAVSGIDERAAAMQPCQIGIHALCCKHCMMGPCRLMNENRKSVCGADQALVVARNILRFAAGGAAAHCGHARHTLDFLGKRAPRRYIRKKAPPYLYELWDSIGVLPSRDGDGHFFDISEAIHLTTFGVDADFRDILRWCLRIGIIDGYFGLYLATGLEHGKWGFPKPRRATVSLGCIDPGKVNIAIHGHEPLAASALVEEAARHENVNLVGVCCSGVSLQARYGVPLAAHVTLQEDVVRTGLIEAMVVDVQCVMPSLSEMCECFHTRLITTSGIGRMPNAIHLPVTDAGSAAEMARKVIGIAGEGKTKRRPGAEAEFLAKAGKPVKALVGFSGRSVDAKGLWERYEKKRIRGFIAVVGCVSPRSDRDAWVTMFRELSEEYVIFTTGCMGFEFARAGLLDGERFFHLGSCVNNAHIAEIFRAISEEAGRRIDEMPFLVSAPMAVTEKCVAIGLFFAALGCSIHLGYPHVFSANQQVVSCLEETLGDLFKSRILLCDHPRNLYGRIRENGL